MAQNICKLFGKFARVAPPLKPRDSLYTAGTMAF